MRPMAIDISKRNFTKALTIGTCAPSLLAACATNNNSSMVTDVHGALNKSEALIGGAIRRQGQFEVVVYSVAGQARHQIPLPGRGHGVAIAPNQEHAVMFARRPGSYAMVFNYVSGNIDTLIPAESDRHFYGHGVYSNDGRWLYATEGDRSTSLGIVGVYDVENGYRKVEEFSGIGIGPHEIITMSDGRLVVGVGGVHTQGRSPLNLDTMNPSLSYLSESGELLEQVSLQDKHKSIRHLAHDGEHTVLCGQQYRGEPDDYVPLVAMHRKGEALVELGGEPEDWARFNHYVASIATTESHILATSPRGNCYGIWDKATRELLEINALPDASGVVVKNGEFHVSSGIGRVVKINADLAKQTFVSGIQWDNHWSAIT
ncbi:DUF1513 domain-containing protein [Vibrio sp. SCSIO 43140]|uniref:DUF1513 domain-containing protein n=1 Tax=Vibrio sp. SCSIO 43140 TaxID=2819100 RepID=UPI002075C891|nr:DUF1513 domain-containing protein [Vibrio sp. SCSIO 43140]USD61581.1 DUF1513 domain-containing protein [Vibrio sp. SCSIO 43140]